jgi:hypothetical protein
MMTSKNYCTYAMSISDCGIMLMSGYEGQTSTETTREYKKMIDIRLISGYISYTP